MQRKQLDFSQLFDVRAVRVVVSSIPDCYAALGIVHGRWPYVPGEFDDYIATPKGNGYRSIHTAVIGPQAKSVEVQIRTREMHEHAELGVAAHWTYK
jgi:GTP pyrophosphokinase